MPTLNATLIVATSLAPNLQMCFTEANFLQKIGATKFIDNS